MRKISLDIENSILIIDEAHNVTDVLCEVNSKDFDLIFLNKVIDGYGLFYETTLKEKRKKEKKENENKNKNKNGNNKWNIKEVTPLDKVLKLLEDFSIELIKNEIIKIKQILSNLEYLKLNIFKEETNEMDKQLSNEEFCGLFDSILKKVELLEYKNDNYVRVQYNGIEFHIKYLDALKEMMSLYGLDFGPL